MNADESNSRTDEAKGAGRPEHPPRLGEVEGDEGMPGSFIDDDRNLPGDQPTDTRGPNKSELEGTT